MLRLLSDRLRLLVEQVFDGAQLASDSVGGGGAGRGRADGRSARGRGAFGSSLEYRLGHCLI